MAQSKPIPFRKRKAVPEIGRPASRLLPKDKVEVCGEVLVLPDRPPMRQVA